MADTLELSFEERKVLAKIDESLAASSEVDTSEIQKLTTEEIKSLKETLPKESKLLAKLNHLEGLVQAKGNVSRGNHQSYDEGEVGGTQPKSNDKKPTEPSTPAGVPSWNTDIKNKATGYLQKPFETNQTGVFDQSEYIYGVLLRHGVMPDKNIGFFNANPNDPAWKQALMNGMKYALDKMPIVKYVDFPADIGRATYMYPTRARNAFVNQLGKMKKDEFDAMLMAFSGEKDYHQKLLTALTEIHAGLQGERAKKEITEWIRSTTAQRDKLNQMMDLIKTGNPDITGLSNHMTEYIGLKRGYSATEFRKIMDIHNETDPTRKQQLIDGLKGEIAAREKAANDAFRKTQGERAQADRSLKAENVAFEADKKQLEGELKGLSTEESTLKGDRDSLLQQKAEIERKITSAERQRDSLQGKEKQSPLDIERIVALQGGSYKNANGLTVNVHPDKHSILGKLTTELQAKNNEINKINAEITAKNAEITAKNAEITQRTEKHVKESAQLQKNLDSAKTHRDAASEKLKESRVKTQEQRSVVSNVESGHYSNVAHQEGGANRYARATGNLDPQMASMNTTMSARNTTQNVAAKKQAVAAELNSPEMQKLAELERRGLVAEFNQAADAVESLSKGAEEAIAKLKGGNTAESKEAAEKYLRDLGEAIKGTNDKIGAINDKSLAHFSSLPKIDQDALLKASIGTASYKYISRLASHEAAMKGHAEAAMKVNSSKPMRFMYGLIGIVAAGSLSFEYVAGDKEVAKNDLKDMAYGFVPGYDLYRAWDGTDLNGRPIRGLDRFERAAWGTLTLAGAIATFGASSLVVGGLRTGVRGVKAANTLGNIVKVGSSGMAVASVSHFGYNMIALNHKQVGSNGESVVRLQ